MAAWRGRRAMTWITGAVAFLASIGTAFTGYLVQTNFDSQWISFEAKDGLNAVGIGAFFNVTNLGQMLLLHACLLPLVVGVIVVWHVLLVRRRGVVPPIDAVDSASRPQLRPAVPTGGGGPVMSIRTTNRSPSPDIAAREWKGPWRRYDIVKEGVIAVVVVSVLTVLLAGLFSSPDEPQLTFQGWADQRAGQLLRHRRPGTGRHQRVRRLRAAVQHRGRRRSRSVRSRRRSGSASRTRSTRRNDFVLTPLRSQAAAGRRGRRPGGLGRGERRPADRVGDGLRHRAHRRRG